MTHTVQDEVPFVLRENPLGFQFHVHEVDLNITSLDEAGVETSFTAADHLHQNADVIGVEVVGQENPQYLITYNKSLEELHVNNATDAGNVTAGTDIGEVSLVVLGRDAV